MLRNLKYVSIKLNGHGIFQPKCENRCKNVWKSLTQNFTMQISLFYKISHAHAHDFLFTRCTYFDPDTADAPSVPQFNCRQITVASLLPTSLSQAWANTDELSGLNSSRPWHLLGPSTSLTSSVICVRDTIQYMQLHSLQMIHESSVGFIFQHS